MSARSDEGISGGHGCFQKLLYRAEAEQPEDLAAEGRVSPERSATGRTISRWWNKLGFLIVYDDVSTHPSIQNLMSASLITNTSTVLCEGSVPARFHSNLGRPEKNCKNETMAVRGARPRLQIYFKQLCSENTCRCSSRKWFWVLQNTTKRIFQGVTFIRCHVVLRLFGASYSSFASLLALNLN